MNAQGSRRAAIGVRLLVLFAALLAATLVLVPVWLLHPFRQQDPGDVALAYTLRRWSPVLTLLILAIVAPLVLWSWRAAQRWWQRAGLAAALVAAGVMAWLARQNHFEWMFGPVDRPDFVAASAVGFLDDEDMVLGVTIGGETAAYPVRQLAYHHVLHDVVGGKPIVATY
jgi:hypothetical protein